MATVRCLVLRAAGINCEVETAFGWERAGARADCVHVHRLFEAPTLLDAYQVLTVPGGFSYGDDIASGRILANQLRYRLGDALRAFVDRGGLVLGICNGFQVLARLGLLPGDDCGTAVSLGLNASGRYEDRWVRLRVESPHCAFLEPGATLHLPIGHGEGRFLVKGGESALAVLKTRNRVALVYAAADGSPATAYPENPNGSTGSVAGLTDATGRVLGLMPHPDRNLFPENAPRGVFGDGSVGGQGMSIFERAVRHFL